MEGRPLYVLLTLRKRLDSNRSHNASVMSETERYWSTKPLYKCLGCGLIWDGNAQCTNGEEECGSMILLRYPKENLRGTLDGMDTDEGEGGDGDDAMEEPEEAETTAEEAEQTEQDTAETEKGTKKEGNKSTEMMVETEKDENELNNRDANNIQTAEREDAPPNKKQKLTASEEITDKVNEMIDKSMELGNLPLAPLPEPKILEEATPPSTPKGSSMHTRENEARVGGTIGQG
mgnify:CR=1 FL=1